MTFNTLETFHILVRMKSPGRSRLMLDLASKKSTVEISSSYCMPTSNRIIRSFTPLPEKLFDESTSSTNLLPVVEQELPSEECEDMASLTTLMPVTEQLPELLSENIFERPASLTTLLIEIEKGDQNNTDEIEIEVGGQNGTEEMEIEVGDQNGTEKNAS